MCASHSPESNPNEPISQVTVTSLEAQQAELLALLQSLTTGSDEPFKVLTAATVRHSGKLSFRVCRARPLDDDGESAASGEARALCRWSCSS